MIKKTLAFLVISPVLMSCSTFHIIAPIDKAITPITPPIEETAMLFPNSNPEHFVPCDLVFSSQKEFNDALQCFNESGAANQQLEIKEHPRCWLVSTESPDISHADSFHYLKKLLPQVTIDPEKGVGIAIQELNILGLFVTASNNIYIIDNVDRKAIYRHELHHNFLKLSGVVENGNAHDNVVWGKCEPATYTPSKISKISGWLRRFSELFGLKKKTVAVSN